MFDKRKWQESRRQKFARKPTQTENKMGKKTTIKEMPS